MEDGESHPLETLLDRFDWFPVSLPKDIKKAYKQVSIKSSRKPRTEPVTLSILAEGWIWEFCHLTVGSNANGETQTLFQILGVYLLGQ